MLDQLCLPPVSLRLRSASRLLEIDFGDQGLCVLPYLLLRVRSPSADIGNCSPTADIGIERIEPVGNYAIRPVFSDGHATGIFTWRFLRELCRVT